jgi:hypothetical protein
MASRTAHVALCGLLLLAVLACSVEAHSKCPVDKIMRSLLQAAGGGGGFQWHHHDKQQQQQQQSAHQEPHSWLSARRAHRKLQQTAGTYPGTGSPAERDWVSVVSACRTLTSYEKRFCNFYVRASFHDSLSTTATCGTGPACGGLGECVRLA